MNKSLIKNICDVSDCLHVTPEYVDEGYPMVRVSEIGNDFLNLSKALRVSKENYDLYTSNYHPQKGDIILARVGAFLGQFAYVDTEEEFCIGQNTTILHPHKHGKYIYYNLISDVTQQRLQKEAAGSAYKSVGVDSIKNFSIDMPDDLTADKIGNLLYAIDKKIHLNNAINDYLQQQAMTIYDYWFTQFDFPDENGNPYRSSGGQMIWSEQLKREIPIGWEVRCLSELLQKNTRAFDYLSEQPAIDLSVMPSNSIALSILNKSSNFATNLFEMKQGDILFGSIRPYLHKAGIAPCDGVVAGTVHSYTTINELDYNFALITMSRDAFFDFAVNVSTGTRMPVVSSDTLLTYKVAFSQEIVHKFNCLSLKEPITINIQENLELIKLRDWLLPMLMNGQITITD